MELKRTGYLPFKYASLLDKVGNDTRPGRQCRQPTLHLDPSRSRHLTLIAIYFFKLLTHTSVGETVFITPSPHLLFTRLFRMINIF